MHNEFPKMIFRAPGPVVWEGFAHEYNTVHCADELENALADGWHATVHDAMAAAPKASALAVAEAFEAMAKDVAEDAPPTRAELEQKAKELKIKFDGRTTDKKLAAAIAEAV